MSTPTDEAKKAARWVVAECHRFGNDPKNGDEGEAVAVMGEVLASGLLACEHLKDEAP